MNEEKQHRALPVLSDGQSSPPSTRDSSLRIAIVLAARWLLIAALVAALHVAARQRNARRASASVVKIEVSQATLDQWFGEAATEATFDGRARQANVADADGEFLGRVVQTLPDSESVTGYRGSSNLLIGIDPEETIAGVRLLSSEDTVDHVRSIERSERFFSQFQGRSASGSFSDVDVVSGATLTSLAMAESIAVRLGNQVMDSARFPEPISPEECGQVFPAAAHCEPHSAIPGAIAVVGDAGESLGTLVRTGPLADRVNGYQGPSELLLGFDQDERLMHVTVRRTFDNEPYASYVEDEPWYWDPFLGKTTAELAPSDLDSLGIEGVSGATMSTVAAAETLIKAAQTLVRQRAAAEREAEGGRTVRWAWKDSGTILVLLGSLWITFGRFRGKRRIRRIWQVIVVVLFGFVTGNLLSIALLLGWGTSGVPWHLAPGLAAVVLFAFAIPLFTKSPIYCTQLCPHGALQQWLRRVPTRKFSIPTRLNGCLLEPIRKPNQRPRSGTDSSLSPRAAGQRGRERGFLDRLLAIPGLLCAAAYWVALSGSPIDLANWEPFDAYVVWIGISGSIIVAIVSLGLAALTPMGYCRFACPTGRVLAYTRRHAQSGRWMSSDWAVVLLAASAWGWIFLQSKNVL